MDLEQQLVETWEINQRINLYLLEAIPDEALTCASSMGGRSVALQFAHIHAVRLMWLETAAPALMTALAKIPTRTKADKAAITREVLSSALAASGEATTALIRMGLAKGKISGFKPHPTAFVGYLIAHEAYHRAEVGLILTECGHPLDSKIAYGLWEWGAR